MAGKIAYIGFGVLGNQLAVLIRQSTDEPPLEIYFDDHAAEEKIDNAYPFNAWRDERFAEYDFFVCLGYKHLAEKAALITELKKAKRKLSTYIHPSAIINPDAVIAPGCVIYAGCNVDQHVILKEGVFLNNSVTISHDSVIGANTFIAPGAVLCGYVEVGEQCFIGAGTIISNWKKIGNKVIAGIGTVITSDVAAGSSVIGNPMRILAAKLDLQ